MRVRQSGRRLARTNVVRTAGEKGVKNPKRNGFVVSALQRVFRFAVSLVSPRN